MNQVLNENIKQAEIWENLRQVKKRINLACERAGRYPKEVKLLLATKVPAEKIKGLMTIGLFSGQNEKVRNCFRKLKEIQQDALALNLPNADFSELSMGMSNDLEIAIEEGATIVRVGTTVFGQRKYSDSY